MRMTLVPPNVIARRNASDDEAISFKSIHDGTYKLKHVPKEIASPLVLLGVRNDNCVTEIVK